MGLESPTINTSLSSTTTATKIIADDLEVDSGTLSIDADNNRVGVGTTSPGVQLEIQDTTTSSANTGGALRLSANDGAVMGDSHRLGVIEFTGAEDTSNTQVVGARIEAMTDAAWTNAENGAALYFYTTDGNASQTNVLKLDSNKKATFAGEVAAVSLSSTTTSVDVAATIGDGTTTDTYLKFDGNAVDYRIGLDDGTDKLEFGVGHTHGTTTAFTIDSSQDVAFSGVVSLTKDLVLNSTPADETVSGITALFTAGEALSRGEVVYFKPGDSKMWKAVATGNATSRCVAMAAEDIASDATGPFLLEGFLADNGTFPAYTVAGALYTPEAETSGENVPEQTAPDTDGDFVQVIGWAVTANSVYFKPSNDIIEVA